MITDPEKNSDYQTAGLKTRQMDIIARSQKGVKRRENQDRFFVKEFEKEAIIAVIADGMGGEAGGDIAARMAASSFENIQEIRQGKEKDFLVAMFKKTDKQIFQVSTATPELENMGTTLIAVLIRNKKACWVHVGDSRIFLFRKGGLKQITQDQTFARFLFEEGEITKEQLSTHYSQHILDQCIGHGRCVPEKGSFSLKKKDLIILSTDGLHKILDSLDMKEILTADILLEKKAEKLIQMAMDKGGHDDMTIVLVHFL